MKVKRATSSNSISSLATGEPLKAQPATPEDHTIENFSSSTRCIVYGMQQRAVQGMLDFDFMCKREKPSVAAMVFPFSGNHYVKFYWGTEEVRAWQVSSL